MKKFERQTWGGQAWRSSGREFRPNFWGEDTTFHTNKIVSYR